MGEYVASLVISTFQRPHLLRWGLCSLTQQQIPFEYEIIVVNDGVMDETEAICAEYQSRLHLRYIFSGGRNLSGTFGWRVPGFAINIGARQAKGRVLMISCAEIFHMNNTIAAMVNPILGNNTLLTIPVGKDDRDGSFLQSVINLNGGFEPRIFDTLPELNVRLPFLIAVDRVHFNAIRGYDEDFTGIAFDDDDLVGRLQSYGCRYHQTPARIVHLYHPRYVYETGMNPAWHYNRNLYLSRQNILVRNTDREWGRL